MTTEATNPTEEYKSNRAEPPQPAHRAVIKLVDGGFSADTEVMSTDGPVGVADLVTGNELYALNPVTQIVKPKRLTDISVVSSEKDVIEIQTKRADFRVAEAQRVPYLTKSITHPRFESADELTTRSYYKFIRKWRYPTSQQCGLVDITDFVDDYEICASTNVHGHSFRAALPEGCEPVRRNSHVGYYFDPETFKEYQSDIETTADKVAIHSGPNSRLRPYQFDRNDFIQLIGWYVTEGSVHWPQSRDTAQVKIAQQTEKHRRSIKSLFARLGLQVHCNARKFEFGSRLFGQLLEKLCGARSKNKHLPTFVWDLSKQQKATLLKVLLCGDGNDRQTYYTSSDRLAGDVLRLCLELGVKPRYTRRRGIWHIYIRDVNDGFQPRKHVNRVNTTEKLYQLTVADYSVVMAGRNGKFQWIGVSNVS